MNIIDSGVDTTLEFPICHYCRKRVADKEWLYFDAKLYWINKRTVFPLGYSYTEKIVPIPRCDKCHSFHNKVWNKSGLIGFPIGYGLAAWVTFWANDNSFLSEDGSWYGSVFATIFFGWMGEIFNPNSSKSIAIGIPFYILTMTAIYGNLSSAELKNGGPNLVAWTVAGVTMFVLYKVSQKFTRIKEYNLGIAMIVGTIAGATAQMMAAH